MSKQRVTETKEKCGMCNKTTGSDSWLACEICDGWYHINCVNISEEAYKILQNLETCHWFCTSCNVKMGKVIPTLVKLGDRIEVVDGRVAKLETDVKINNDNLLKMKADMIKRITEIDNKTKHIDEIKCEITEIKNDMRDKATKEEMDKALTVQMEKITEKEKDRPESFADIVKEQLEMQMEQYNESLEHVKTSLDETRAKTLEERDKENRAKNIIIYRAPESKEQRFEERQKEDKTFCLSLIRNGLEMDCEAVEIKRTLRLGKRSEDATFGRPLLVEFNSRAIKNEIMENMNKLRNADDVFKQLSVANDMTQKERQQCKTLVEQAKRKEETEPGNFIYRVRGLPGAMRIVKIQKN